MTVIGEALEVLTAVPLEVLDEWLLEDPFGGPWTTATGILYVPSIDDEATLRRWAAVEYRTRPDLAPGLGLAVMGWAMRQRVRPTLHDPWWIE